MGSYSIKPAIWLLKFTHLPGLPLISAIPQDSFCLQPLLLHLIYLIPMRLRKAQVWTLLCKSTHWYEGDLSCLASSHEDETTLWNHKPSGSVSWGPPLHPITGENLRMIRGNFMMSSLPHTWGLRGLWRNNNS